MAWKCFKHKNPDSRNEAKTELMRVSLVKYYNKVLRGLQKNTTFLKTFLSIYLAKLPHIFESSQIYGFRNEKSIAC